MKVVSKHFLNCLLTIILKVSVNMTLNYFVHLNVCIFSLTKYEFYNCTRSTHTVKKLKICIYPIHLYTYKLLESHTQI